MPEDCLEEMSWITEDQMLAEVNSQTLGNFGGSYLVDGH